MKEVFGENNVQFELDGIPAFVAIDDNARAYFDGAAFPIARADVTGEPFKEDSIYLSADEHAYLHVLGSAGTQLLPIAEACVDRMFTGDKQVGKEAK